MNKSLLIKILIGIIILCIIIIIILIVVRSSSTISSKKPKSKQRKTSESPISYMDSMASYQYNIRPNPILDSFTASNNFNSSPPAPDAKDIQTMRDDVTEWYNNTSSKKNLKSMDKWGMMCVLAAIDSVSIGNWGIGNVLCWAPPNTENDPSKWIELVRGGNRFFARNVKDPLSLKEPITPRLDSHAHGEMMVLDEFENRLANGYYDKSSPNYGMGKDSPVNFTKMNDIIGYPVPDNIILFTQLNSCQMCLARIGNSGISRCYWLGPDTAGGMAHRLCDTAPAYFNMLNRQIHDVADVSNELINFAFNAFAGPEGKWVIYCTWKLNLVSSPQNAISDYGYCKGQWYANNKFGQNAVWDWGGWYRTINMQGGPQLSCDVTN